MIENAAYCCTAAVQVERRRQGLVGSTGGSSVWWEPAPNPVGALSKWEPVGALSSAGGSSQLGWKERGGKTPASESSHTVKIYHD